MKSAFLSLARFTFLICSAVLVALPAASAPLPGNYYQSAGSLSGEPLKQELRAIVSGQRGYPTSSISYAAARDALLASVDNIGNGQVRTCYFSDVYPTSAWTSPLNREHTWPQSLGAGSAPKMTDMHHLFLCEEGINSSRGNSPFGIAAGTITTYNSLDGDPDDRCYRGGNDVFQVSNRRKGDIARAILYMATRYSDLQLVNTGQSVGTNTMGYLDVLLQWNAADPPDALEIERNNRVFDYQNNRNPYVDHPEYVPWSAGRQ